jgi:hypothetical protein
LISLTEFEETDIRRGPSAARGNLRHVAPATG